MTRCFTPRPVAAAQKGPEDYTFFLFIFGLFGVEKEEEEEEEEEGEGEGGGTTGRPHVISAERVKYGLQRG